MVFCIAILKQKAHHREMIVAKKDAESFMSIIIIIFNNDSCSYSVLMQSYIIIIANKN